MDALAQLTSALSGRYTIDREIGAGGMATVYLAHDVKHERNVALKVLNPELGAVLGVERFLSEIKVTANLQHPNLLPLFDSGEAEGLLFYVMPYVQGESLRARLEQEKQLPIEEALHIARSVASALDYAHRHGVIHRDLKPENILLHEGQPLIADFGIALAVSKAGGNRITQTGLSLGTPQYMSPEQATGDRTVDGRSDIYSLGAVLYEMLCGDPPHSGTTAQAIIARMMTERPRSVRVVRDTVPEQVDAALQRALAKLPADRFATAGEFAEALRHPTVQVPTASRATTTDALAAGVAGKGLVHRRRSIVVVAICAAALLAGIALGAFWRGRGQDAGPVLRLVLQLPKDHHLVEASDGSTIAISPAGDRFAFDAIGPEGARLFIRSSEDAEARPITASYAQFPSFSPDGRWIAFWLEGALQKVAVAGGTPVKLATFVGQPWGLHWGVQSTLVIGTTNGLFLIPAGGGAVRQLTKRQPGQVGHFWPFMLPNGTSALYTTYDDADVAAQRGLAAVSVPEGKGSLLDLQGTSPIGIIDGRLIYAQMSGSLVAVAFDEARLRPIGTPSPVLDNVMVGGLGWADVAVARDGTLMYVTGQAETEPVAVTPSGAVAPLVGESHNYSTPRVSPDGDRVAFAVSSSSGIDIWVFDRRKRTLTRVTSNGVSTRPEWTADGKRILFISGGGGDRSGIWWSPADGSAPATLAFKPDEPIIEAIASPDGKWFLYRTGAAKHVRDIFAVPVKGGQPLPLVVSPFDDVQPRLSPDGRWLAYQSNESQRAEIYVRPFPESGARIQVSSGGGTEPVWARSGKTLYYRHQNTIMAVNVTAGSTFSMGDRRVALTGEYLGNPSHADYDVTPDGAFIMIRRAGPEPQIMVVHNWAREMAARLAGNQVR